MWIMSQTRYMADPTAAGLLAYKLHIRLLLLLYLLGLTTPPVASDGICPKVESSHPECDYQQQHLMTFTGLNIPNDCRILDVSDNFLASVEDFVFAHLTDLLSLDLSHNRIIRLGPSSFSGLSNLTCLDLSNNPLSYEAYPRQIFRPLLGLKVLGIGSGKRPTFSRVVYPDLAYLGYLEELYMDMYGNAEFGPGFASLVHLKTLSADHHYCEISRLFNDTFNVFENSTITTLNLAKCSLSGVDIMTFGHFQELKNFNIAGNDDLGLTAAMRSLAGLTGKNLTSIIISKVNNGYSPISELIIGRDKFQYLKDICVKSLDLSDNMVINFDVAALRTLRHPDCLEEFRFKNYYLQLYVADQIYVQIAFFRNLRHLDVSGMLLRVGYSDESGTAGIRLGNTGNRTIRFPPRLQFFNMSHVQVSCAQLSRISFLGLKLLHTLDISYIGGKRCFEIPVYGFEHVKVLNISGNLFPFQQAQKSIPNLTTLVARDANLAVLKTESLAFTRLEHLDLANGGITTVPKGMLTTQLELLTLKLANNKLSELPADIYSLPKLIQLDMRFNVLTSILPRDRRRLDTMVERREYFTLFLEGNPFACNCETYDFVEWIWSSNVQFDNRGNYSCVLSNGSAVPMLNLRSTLADLKIQCVSNFWVIFGALGATVLVICLTGAAVGYRYRVPITYWCITLCRKPEAKPERRHKYDALVAYCHEDYEWVCHTLQPKLEENDAQFGYRLCLYDRDFIPGLSIEENVVNAINSSFKTILVITPAFVRSAWCHFEVQMARMKMIQEGRQDVIIPVILQDVPVTAMPKTLLNLWNTSVFLVWSESPAEQRHFWEKLTCALGASRVSTRLLRGHWDMSVGRELDVDETNEQQSLVSCGRTSPPL